MRLSKVALATAVVIVLVAAHSGGQSLPGLVPARERKTAPNFSLEDSKGAAVRLSDFRGRVVLLDFWATWCTGCKLEMPWFEAYQAKYAAQGLSSIGVAMDDEGW
jgi:peroxiredoxin